MLDKENIIHQLEGYLSTPPLWNDHINIKLKQFFLPPVNYENISQDLQNHSQGLSNILGKRMEYFFASIIRNSDEYNVVAANIQINENKITLGELDFLIQDQNRDQLIHIEVVYKFYIYDPSFTNELGRWIGPNRRDTFLYKIDKLQKKQLPLLFNPITKVQLKKLGIKVSNPIQQICFKALLFIPLNLKGKNFDIINPDCITGFWISFSEFLSPKYLDYGYFLPNKLNWPVNPSRNKVWFPYDDILDKVREIINTERSPLIWIQKNNHVYERMFIVWW